MGLKIKVRKHKDVPIIEVIGEAIGQDVVKITKKIEGYLESSEPVIVLDLTETTVVDSFGLGVFVFSWKQFSEQKRKLVFYNPQGYVLDLFEGTNLDKVLRITESLDDL